MDYPQSMRDGLDLEQFASVALLDAAMNTTSQRLTRSIDNEGQIILDVDGFPSYSANDEYTDDPRFLESQKEFRDLLLTTAQSLAPTRAASPVDAISTVFGSPRISNVSVIRQAVSTRERVEWLRKYLDEVAPWVCRHPPSENSTLIETAGHVR